MTQTHEVTLPKVNTMTTYEVLKSYYSTKQIVPLEVVHSDSGTCTYRYKFLPELNVLCYARLTTKDVGVDLISQSENLNKDRDYLTLPSNANSKTRVTDEQCIYLAWIGLWCAALWYQLPEEQSFRLEQLLRILSLMKLQKWTIPIDLYQFIMQCCLNYGTPDMIIKLYKHLTVLKMRPNGCICSIYFKAILHRQKANLRHRSRESIKEILASNNKPAVEEKTSYQLNPASPAYKEATKHFKERTFCLINEMNIIGDKVLVPIDKIQCMNCRESIDYKLILKQANSIVNPGLLLEVDCPSCKCKLNPQISFRIGKRYTFCEPGDRTYAESAAALMTPQDLRKEVESLVLKATPRVKIQVTKMREHYNKIHWNCIWHFKRQKLPLPECPNFPYDLFLPYKKDIYFDPVVPSVSQVTLTTIENWKKEDEDEYNMQKKYEEKIMKKPPRRNVGVQTDEIPINRKIK
eukprot:TRINITY_DN6126_c0_g1_i1.p1 TRINITY_DN6126_c0_g1~~TRINITY_DN6126_c0_g1_i1.p1  ORF type:complete len:463 (+),score=88.61 TRINITY_DN6126_c0_g1_i1:1874-3262(+)